MQTDGMASITIRDVPDDVRDELAARARLSGRSLQKYLKMHLVGLASRPDPQVLIEQVRARTKRTGVVSPRSGSSRTVITTAGDPGR
jgi:antitoxin FitA